MKFLFLTDTHLGTNPPAFQQQPAYPAQLGRLLSGIQRQLDEDPQIAFILHGGDLVDQCSEDTVRKAVSQFRFSVPLYLSVGNHDLNLPDAEAIWLRHAPQWFASSGSLSFRIRMGNVDLHVMPNHWGPGTRYYWNQSQIPCYSEEEWRTLEENIRVEPDRIHLLSVHHPVEGILPEQTGLAEVIHGADPAFRQSILDLMRRYPQLKLVLSGHNHVNTLHRVEDRLLLSGSAFVESPFEYKVIEIGEDSLRVTTRRLPEELAPQAEYDPAKSYVQGRESDREAVLRW